LNLFYPSTGNFISFVGNRDSRSLIRNSIQSFRNTGLLPSEGASLPNIVQEIGFSDHWAYWQFDYPAFMVTDTAHLRNPHYHKESDTAEKMNYLLMSRLTLAMVQVVQDISMQHKSKKVLAIQQK
ncbi:aminopeptidase, partial [bacterium]|nr:aminopeptidase [bacterium]